MNITEKQSQYAQEIAESLKNLGVRANLDLRNEKIGYKIREHAMQRIPYLVVVGDRELENKQVAIRTQSGEDLGSMTLNDFVARLQAEIAKKGRV